MRKLPLGLIAALLGMATLSVSALAADMPTFRLEAKDGVFKPSQLIVPASKKLMLEIYNTGKTPIEFESTELRKEKAIAPNSDSFVVINPLSPGQYPFFDDFHPKAKGVIVAK
jgi:hypothetical protein